MQANELEQMIAKMHDTRAYSEDQQIAKIQALALWEIALQLARLAEKDEKNVIPGSVPKVS